MFSPWLVQSLVSFASEAQAHEEATADVPAGVVPALANIQDNLVLRPRHSVQRMLFVLVSLNAAILIAFLLLRCFKTAFPRALSVVRARRLAEGGDDTDKEEEECQPLRLSTRPAASLLSL
ncbi:hypothetical protein Efla_003915 [Eimeria flavescens]